MQHYVYQRSEKVEMIFSRRRFLQKNERMNSTLLLWNLRSTCFCFLKIEDTKKTFQNYLTFSGPILNFCSIKNARLMCNDFWCLITSVHKTRLKIGLEFQWPLKVSDIIMWHSRFEIRLKFWIFDDIKMPFKH